MIFSIFFIFVIVMLAFKMSGIRIIRTKTTANDYTKEQLISLYSTDPVFAWRAYIYLCLQDYSKDFMAMGNWWAERENQIVSPIDAIAIRRLLTLGGDNLIRTLRKFKKFSSVKIKLYQKILKDPNHVTKKLLNDDIFQLYYVYYILDYAKERFIKEPGFSAASLMKDSPYNRSIEPLISKPLLEKAFDIVQERMVYNNDNGKTEKV